MYIENMHFTPKKAGKELVAEAAVRAGEYIKSSTDRLKVWI